MRFADVDLDADSDLRLRSRDLVTAGWKGFRNKQ